MNFRILKKDLKRKKSINIILLIFIAMATTFIASSISNMSIIMNATDDFFKMAGLSDHIIITMGSTIEEENENDKKIKEFLENQKNVDKYFVDEELWISDYCIEVEGKDKINLPNSGMLSKINIYQQKFFDKNNNEIVKVEEGTIYLSQNFMTSEGIEENDIVYIKDAEGYRKKFIVVGAIKDAFLGSSLMGVDRFIVSEKDYIEIKNNSKLHCGLMYSVWVDDLENYEKEYYENGFTTIFFCDKAMVKTTYVLDIVIAAIILLVSICLIIVSILMLRFTVKFTIGEDFKEIGILKAIGLTNSSIRMLYTSKYMIISIVGAVIGAIASIPFGELMIEKAMMNIAVSSEGNSVLNVLFSIMVAMVIIFFAYFSTRQIKKMSPMDAIRTGHTGERFRKKSLLKLHGTSKGANMFMALNDILCELKKYIILFITSIVGMWLVIMPVNTINTLSSEQVLPWFGMLKSDFYMIDSDELTEIVTAGDKEVYKEYLEKVKEKLCNNGVDVERVVAEAMFRMKIRYNDISYQSIALQGINTNITEYEYMSGVAPQREDEVAITHVISDIIGAKIGDTVYIKVSDKEEPFIITAIYQSMNNLGEGIRFLTNCDLDYSRLAGIQGIQIDIKNATSANVEKAIDIAKEIYPAAGVYTPEGFINELLGGIVDTISSIKGLILAVVIMINILVVALMQKIFMIREKGEIAMLKAIGYDNHSLYSWQLQRIAMVILSGTVVGVITSELFTDITSGMVFRFMGCANMEYTINTLEVYIIYPITLIVVTLLVCAISIRKIRKINVQEVNDME